MIKVSDLKNKKIPEKKTVDEKIIDYLRSKRGTAFTQAELRNALDLTQSDLSSRLSRLKKLNKVEHIDRYWFYEVGKKVKGNTRKKRRW